MAGAEADKKALLDILVEQGVLTFGDFQLKSGRRSPYFFNLGAINNGRSVERLGEAYAAGIVNLMQTGTIGPAIDTLFGPAYKGIPIAVAASIALTRQTGVDVGWAFNRKEAKDHGEGGQFVGAAVTGRILLLDDVLTAGTAIREAASLIREAGGTLVGVLIALDRQERVDENQPGSAVSRLESELGVPVVSLLNLGDVIEYLDLEGAEDNHRTWILNAIRTYQANYCEG